MRLARSISALGLGLSLATLGSCGGKEEAPEPTPPPTAPPSTAPASPPPSVTQPPPGTSPAGVRPAPGIRPVPSSAPPTTPPRPAATPTPAPTPVPIDHARVAALVSSGEGALGGGRLQEAAAAFADALALDPADTAARLGRARTETTRLGLVRTFVPDLASSEGAEGKITQMAGFESVAELNVKRAVKVPGRAELDGSPAHLKPGDTYTVEIYIRNQSIKKKKDIKIANANVHRIVNDKDSLVRVDWKPAYTKPRERALVATVTGRWEDDVTSWVLEVKLLSEGGDIYENRLVWK
jgi:hypothetical protein